MATIGHYYIKSCIRAAHNKGIDTAALMMMAGISPSGLSKQTRVSDHSMGLLLNSLIEQTQDAFFGFAKAPISPHFYELLLKGVILSKNISQAILLIKTAFSLVGCHLSIDEHKQDTILKLSHHHDDPEHFLQEYLMVFVHRLLSWLANKNIPLERACVSYEPKGYQKEFSLLFRCQSDINHDYCAIVVKTETLQWSIAQEVMNIHQVISQFPLIVLRFPVAENALDRQVYRLIKHYYIRHCNLPDAAFIGQQLNVSSPTLRRQLCALGTSFSQIKTEFRQEQAMRLLKQPNLTIESIASQLDYSEARAFSRMFKQWTQLTPSQYRQLFYHGMT